MRTFNTNTPIRGAFKHLALAVAVAAGLSTSSAQALTTTTVIDLGTPGNGTTVTAGTPVLKIGLGTLPPGSLLRSVSLSYRLDDGNPYLGDLAPLFADSNGNNGVLMIAGEPNDNGYPKPAAIRLPWNSGDNYDIGATGSVTLTATEGVPAIDLSSYAVWLQTGWSGKWSGSITLEYDVPPLGIRLDTPANGEGILAGASVAATATLIEPTPATGPYTIKFHTKLLPAGTPVEWTPTNVGALYTADLGVLAAGDYEIYADVTDSAAPTPGTATSVTRAFTVAPLTSTTTVLAIAGPATTYGGNVTFTATVDPVPTGGTVQFLDGDDFVGGPVAVNTITGQASVSTTTLSAGTHEITAVYSGYQIYETSTTAASISQVVGKAPLTVKALSTLRAPNTANPSPLPYQITGYQNGQDLASSGVTGAPELTTTALLSSPVGAYPITCAIGTLLANNYSFTLVGGTLTVEELVNTFSVNFYPAGTTNVNWRMTPELPAGSDDWFTIGWSNFEVPWNPGAPLPAVTLTSNKASTATFTFKDCRNGWWSAGEPRTTNLGVGDYNLMGSGVNSTLLADGGSNIFDMEMTNIPFAVYDVIFYIRANDGQFGDGTGVIKFNGGADRALKLKSGAFDGNFIEMVDATTEGNYIVFHNVSGSSFTAQTWGTGDNGFNHLGPAGFQVREVVAPGNTYTTWANTNAGSQSPDQDYDNDGVDNGIEYFMGQTGSSFTGLPGLDGTNTVTWPASATYAGTYEVQTSPDLVTWTNVTPKPTPSGGNLSYLLPSGLGKQFVRLLVTPTLP